MRIFPHLSATLILSAAVLAAASQPKLHAAKQAWQWTDEERIIARFGHLGVPGRAATDAQGDQSDAPGQQHFMIDGSRTPELFLPHELFESLIGGLSPDPARRARARELLAPGLRATGFSDPEIFWQRLQNVSKPYLAARGRAGFNSLRPGTLTKEAEAEACSTRIASLNAARLEFGGAKFDELLYTLVAPQMHYAFSTNYPNPAERLRLEAEGCK